MWWNGTQNIYILIFMVLCIYGSFLLSHLVAFRPFLGSLFPPKCITEGSFELGRGGVCEKSEYKICLSTPTLNFIFCAFFLSWNNFWARTLSQLCFILFFWVAVKRHFIFLERINFWSFGIKKRKFVFMKSVCSIISCSLGKHIVVCVFSLSEVFSAGFFNLMDLWNRN